VLANLLGAECAVAQITDACGAAKRSVYTAKAYMCNNSCSACIHTSIVIMGLPRSWVTNHVGKTLVTLCVS
jgi:hypothetical protein